MTEIIINALLFPLYFAAGLLFFAMWTVMVFSCIYAVVAIVGFVSELISKKKS